MIGLSKDAKTRKATPIGTGVLDYFPDALAEVAHVSFIGNEQHNPGTPLHWDRAKSTDEADCIIRHFLERGTFDTDGLRHSAKMAWRALALLQKELENVARQTADVGGSNHTSPHAPTGSPESQAVLGLLQGANGVLQSPLQKSETPG